MEVRQKSPALLDRYLPSIAIAVLLLVMYGPLMVHWVDGWLNKSISIEHEYFSHGLLGIPYAVYMVWRERHRWHDSTDRANLLGAIAIGLAGAFYLSGLWDLVNLSLPVMLLGICLWFKGIEGLRGFWFPLLLVLLATPNDLPYLIAPYTMWLQSAIAGTAGFILTMFGLNVTVAEIYLLVGGRMVEVAPHCAGIKMLFTTIYVALILLDWTGILSSRGKSIAFLSCAIAISVITNVFRNTILTFFYGTGRDDLFHWLHEGWGGDGISIVMLGLLIPTLNLVENVAGLLSSDADNTEPAQ
ncbi:MAG: cyanoexosortase B [Cyanobacteriota bacterium]|nr:cyanoexosortase B [Cyanobacteriota bacterium]